MRHTCEVTPAATQIGTLDTSGTVPDEVATYVHFVSLVTSLCEREAVRLSRIERSDLW